MQTEDFSSISYLKHEETYKSDLDSNESSPSKTTVNWWRHQRMYNTINPILKFDKNAKWLTVGDGNYGHGANHIISHNGNALATDISTPLLEEAKKIDYIKVFSKENAEKLSFENNEFDYSFCKEAYHHFPRPMVALYEMLRVSKKGIILIEPNDAFTGKNKLREILRLVKKMFGKNITRHEYETVGNYKYTISRREIEKVALGLNYKCIAFKGINDHFIDGDNEEIKENGPKFNKIQKKIKIQNFLCKLGLTDFALLTAVIFKNTPDKEMLNEMEKVNFEVIHLPSNPYIGVSDE